MATVLGASEKVDVEAVKISIGRIKIPIEWDQEFFVSKENLETVPEELKSKGIKLEVWQSRLKGLADALGPLRPFWQRMCPKRSAVTDRSPVEVLCPGATGLQKCCIQILCCPVWIFAALMVFAVIPFTLFVLYVIYRILYTLLNVVTCCCFQMWLDQRRLHRIMECNTALREWQQSFNQEVLAPVGSFCKTSSVNLVIVHESMRSYGDENDRWYKVTDLNVQHALLIAVEPTEVEALKGEKFIRFEGASFPGVELPLHSTLVLDLWNTTGELHRVPISRG